MTSHLALLILFAVLVSVVFATLMRDDPPQQLRLGARLFGGFVAVALVLSWVLYALPL